MSKIIPDIESLKSVVKINATVNYGIVEPFINDAIDIYIEPQVGNVIVELAEQGNDTWLTDRMRRALGPLAMALATDEFSVMFGDSGITVDNQRDKKSPANEAKIAAAKNSLFYRGMAALDRLIDGLARKPTDYPDYRDHVALQNHTPCFIGSAREYQDIGLVNIEYSALSYRTIYPTLLQLQERSVKEMLTVDLYSRLLSSDIDNPQAVLLRVMVIRFLANKAAELFTSQTTRNERTSAQGSRPEYQPVIRPVYQDLSDTGNFFADQSNYYAAEINSFITDNSDALNVVKSNNAIDFNRADKKIFTSCT